MIKLTLDLPPAPKLRPRLGRRGNTFTPMKTRIAERKIASLLSRLVCPERRVTDKGQALTLKVDFYVPPPKRAKPGKMPVTRPDIDNYLKLLCDAANGILWVDDSQLVHVEARKLYDWTARKGRIEVMVEECK